jgi:hypothetical protein
MNIVFNMLRCGLGNNGGTRTVLKCVEILERLGHRCEVAANVDNFTWFKHKPVIRSLPKNLDALINAAAVDFTSTIQARTDVVKAWYIRAHESWSNSEESLVRAYKTPGVLNIVNSNGLKEQLLSFKATSEVVYQGIDFDLWYDMELRPKNKIRIGCLYTTQSRKRWRDFVKLSRILGTKDYEYVGIGNSVPKSDFLTDFKHNVGPDALRELYSSCHIWFAPTENEGLHNPPMEAALCGALIVCSNHPLNGMVYDYAVEETAMIYEFDNLKQAVNLIYESDWSRIPVMQKYIRTHIGSREDNMKKLVRILHDNN